MTTLKLKKTPSGYEVTIGGRTYSLFRDKSEYGDYQWVLDSDRHTGIAQFDNLDAAKRHLATLMNEPKVAERVVALAEDELVSAEEIVDAVASACRKVEKKFGSPDFRTTRDGAIIPDNYDDKYGGEWSGDYSGWDRKNLKKSVVHRGDRVTLQFYDADGNELSGEIELDTATMKARIEYYNEG